MEIVGPSLTGGQAADYTSPRRAVKLEVIRVIDDDGNVIHPEREPALSGDDLRKLFRTTVMLEIVMAPTVNHGVE